MKRKKESTQDWAFRVIRSTHHTVTWLFWMVALAGLVWGWQWKQFQKQFARVPVVRVQTTTFDFPAGVWRNEESKDCIYISPPFDGHPGNYFVRHNMVISGTNFP